MSIRGQRLSAAPALGQDAPETTTAQVENQEEPVTSQGDIIVTATRRSELLSEVTGVDVDGGHRVALAAADPLDHRVARRPGGHPVVPHVHVAEVVDHVLGDGGAVRRLQLGHGVGVPPRRPDEGSGGVPGTRR